MAWDFEPDPEFQKKLDWIEDFMREEVEPLSHLGMAAYSSLGREKFIKPLQQKVRDQKLWACHLGPELGGQGYGQLKLAQLNEILGKSIWGPRVFGTQAPDTGNAEILAHYGTAEQKQTYLDPLLEGDIVSCFSMTEPQGGAEEIEERRQRARERSAVCGAASRIRDRSGRLVLHRHFQSCSPPATAVHRQYCNCRSWY